MDLKNSLKNIIAAIVIITFWALLGFIAYKRLSTAPPAVSYCNDYGCTNFRDGTNWSIRNCQGTDTTEGSKYTCTAKGQTGTCGTKTYCCPGPGLLWSTDMNICNQGQQNSDCCACPTPTPVMIVSQCNGPCMTSGNCATGSICIYDQGYGWVCRNPACYKNTVCSCTSVTPTSYPTPTSYQDRGTYRCGELCSSSLECESDLRCLSVGNTRECRSPDCPDSNTCVCIQ